MDDILNLKFESVSTENNDDFTVEYSVLSPVPIVFPDKSDDPRRKAILEKIEDIDFLMSENQKTLDEYSAEIERLTCHADGLDYTIAVASGLITGVIDSLLDGEFDF